MEICRYGFVLCLFTCSLCINLLVSRVAFSAEVLIEYKIPRQSLNNGLMQFAADSNLELIFISDKIRGLKSKAIVGEMTAKQALELLLQGSGYSYQFIDTNTVTIVPSTKLETSSQKQEPVPQINQSQRVKVLQPLTIRAKEKEQKTGDKQLSDYSFTRTTSATRTDTAIKMIPQSIQVITRSLIDNQATLSVSESLKNISGVTVGNSQLTPSFDYTHIRGFPAEQLVDGFTQYYNAGDRESLVNIDRIEVLKGSNALLYGGGSGSPAGGLVNIVSKLPVQKVIREVGVKYGGYQYYQSHFDLNQPISQHILFRVTAEYTHSGSYIDVLETERYNINPALTLTNNDSTQFILQGKFSNWEQVDYQGLPAQGTHVGDFSISPSLYLGPKDIDPSRAQFGGVWGSFDHKVNDTFSLSIKARYTESEFNQKVQAIVGADGLQADKALFSPSTWAIFNTQLFQQQQELSFVAHGTVKFTIGPIENTLLLGTDYSQFKDEGFINSTASALGLVDLSKPLFDKPYQQPGPASSNIFVTNQTYGSYLQLQSSWYQTLHLLAGVRLGNVSIDYKNFSTTTPIEVETGKTKFLPRLGAVFDVTDDYSWFISYSEGMRGQPFINFVSTPEPEISAQWESGVKFDNKRGLSGQVAVYQIDRSHIAVTDNTDVKRRSITTGEQRSQGVEVDLTWQLNDEVSLLGNYAYTDARYLEHQPARLKGQSLPHIPRHAGKFWLNYQFSHLVFSGLSIGGGVYAQSGVTLENSEFQKSERFYQVDVAAIYETEHIKLTASLKNLTNEQHFESLNYFGGRFAPAQPISAYMSFSVRY